MSETVATERGPKPAADYASAILLLPGIYVSWGEGVAGVQLLF